MIELLEYLKGNKVAIELSNGNKKVGYIYEVHVFNDRVLEFIENKDSLKHTRNTFIPLAQVVAVTDLENNNTNIDDPEDVAKDTENDQKSTTPYITAMEGVIDLEKYSTTDEKTEDHEIVLG